ncbi:MAG: hypothetical protein ACR2JS_08945, partial [Candidatus Nanopelagicales bacterium]
MKEQTLQDDPNIKLPAAVRAAAARSEQIVNALNGDQPQVTSEGNEEAPQNDGQPPLNAEAEATQEAKPEAKAEPRQDDESWEHKYKSVHGRYLRAQEQLREMADQIQGLQNVIATMQAAPQQVDIPELQAERLITEDE